MKEEERMLIRILQIAAVKLAKREGMGAQKINWSCKSSNMRTARRRSRIPMVNRVGEPIEDDKSCQATAVSWFMAPVGQAATVFDVHFRGGAKAPVSGRGTM